MGVFTFLFFVCLIIFVVFVLIANSDNNNVKQNISATMYGGVPIINQQMQTEPEVDIVAKLEKESARIEALIQAAEAGHDDVHQQIEDGSYTGPWPERRNDGAWTSIFDDLRILSIAGINHRQNISHYKGRNTVALVPEPKNEFDPNAIKVVAEDGHHLGYIQRHQTDMVRDWAHDQFPHYCICMIQEHEDEDDGHRFFTGYLYFVRT